MKPTPQISSPKNQVPRTFPQTDFAYQTTLEKPHTSSSSQKARVLPSSSHPRPFWKLCTDYFRTECSDSFVGESISLIGLVGLSAWPLGTAIYSIVRAMFGY